jgi:hypothetical protein
MRSLLALSVVLVLCTLLPKAAAVGEVMLNREGREASEQSVVVGKYQIVDSKLVVDYEIRNKGKRDIWLCDDVDVLGWDCDVHLDPDGPTLVVSRRLDVPLRSLRDPPLARYVRLPSQQSRIESLILPLPVHLRSVFGGGGVVNGPVDSERLVIEIGYFSGDMPGMIHNILEKVANAKGADGDADLMRIKEHTGGLSQLYALRESEYLRYGSDEFLIYYNFQALKGEQAMRAVIEDLRIPYNEQGQWPELLPPDHGDWSRIEAKFEPSALEFFFPYPTERSLLSGTEKEHLQSVHTIIVGDAGRIRALFEEIGEPEYGGIFTHRSKAHLVCRGGNDRQVSFDVLDDTYLISDGQRLFRYPRGLTSLGALFPEIRPYELRQQCARNLADLASRLQWLRAKGGHRVASDRWCDTIVREYRNVGLVDKFLMRPFRCPSASDAKSHYAMNPNCGPDSSGGTVLLFETQNGWNQHGGPELFTFDNHDPKGGLVLLNDGTVKFIRTEEQLKQLRWK